MTNGFDYRREIKKWLITYFILFLIIICTCILVSCGPTRIVTETNTVIEYRDSTVFRDSTVYVPIPIESHSTIAKDSSSLETSLAFSKAWTDSLGLHHTLENKRGNMPYTIHIPLRTITDKARTNHNDSIIVEKKVEKDLSFMQTIKIWCFWPLLILTLFTYRKQIASLWPLIRKFITII